MGAEFQAAAQITTTAAPTSTRGICLQRQCAPRSRTPKAGPGAGWGPCGGALGFDGECEECRQKNLLHQRGAEWSAAAPIKSVSAPAPQKPAGRSAALAASRPGYRFDRIKVHPGKAFEQETEDTGEEKPDPTAGGDATIKCDGKGGYEILLNDWATATCGTKDCVIAHESSHMADWKAKWPTGCKDQAKGYLPKGDPPDDPLMTVAEYNAFLKTSECKAHTADLNCANALTPTDACKDTVKNYIKTTETQKKKWC